MWQNTNKYVDDCSELNMDIKCDVTVRKLQTPVVWTPRRRRFQRGNVVVLLCSVLSRQHLECRVEFWMSTLKTNEKTENHPCW